MNTRAIIVEDSKHAQEHLVGHISQQDDIELVGVASDLEEAEELCNSLKPDLVFCDVMVPPATSFDWLLHRKEVPFDLIFTTSYEEFAVKAFRLAAVDYLIKPIDPIEFNNALNKYRNKNRSEGSRIAQLLANLTGPKAKTKVALPTFTGYIFVEISDIIRCESDNTYTTFFLQDKRKILVSRTLKDVESMLGDYSFCRVHNSHLINLAYVAEYYKGEGGQVRLNDGTVVDVARRRKEEFLSQLK
ncbi:LytTR family DNA-binding domain-containing protein [Algoriphagus sp. NG3]|uniref:LytR/AlgR family response regulator transcription factor n=1 Tax=Algoriphagus sp. NG3 TaxID=3097546 RepID=UPI002A807453|nr:LytTR family DNA-binding domain-containing protein [Algoriphagus sp. NG3]WPR77685.1 LytTR family DNA-binding domain-containing protein [Algoriphagus sp. NG3]